MKRFPWGISAGVFAMFASVFAIALVALTVISHMMIASVGGDDGLLTNWWVYLLYALDATTVVGFIVSLVFYCKRNRDQKRERRRS